MAHRFFVIDTNVLIKADEGAGPARTWLLEFAADNEASLIVDFESRPDDAHVPYFQRHLLSHIMVGNPRSRILVEYQRYVQVRNPWMQIVTGKLAGTPCIVSVEYEGPHAILPSGFKSRVDPSDGKFVMAAIGYIRHHPMGPRFRPTIVYAADYADWEACRDELENRYFVNMLRL